MVKNFYISKRPESGVKLTGVAQAFSELQQKRKRRITQFSPVDVCQRRGWLDNARIAIMNWRDIRTEDESKSFLLALFMPKLSK